MRVLRKIRRLIIDSFGFSKTEANGFLLLIALVFLVAVVPRLYLKHFRQRVPSQQVGQSLEEWEAEMNASIEKKEFRNITIRPTIRDQSPFDPNTSSVKEMINGGLPKFIANRIVKYREKGGVFRRSSDLKKMYGMTDSLFSHVKSFLSLPDLLEKSSKDKNLTNYQPSWTKKEVVRFNLNEATLEELQSVSGIGPVLSELIVKYRDLLGGFYSTDQLKEVWGLDEETIEKVINQSDFSGEVKQTPINTDSIKRLSSHPYINYNLARAIINYRQVHGAFQSLDELLEIKLMNDSLYQKLSPYLSLQ